MRDMRAATTAILSPWMDDAVALVANGYFPGATYEFMVGHVAYEAARGGASGGSRQEAGSSSTWTRAPFAPTRTSAPAPRRRPHPA